MMMMDDRNIYNEKCVGYKTVRMRWYEWVDSKYMQKPTMQIEIGESLFPDTIVHYRVQKFETKISRHPTLLFVARAVC